MHVKKKKRRGVGQNSKTERRNWSVRIQNEDDAEDVPTSLKRELDVDGRSQRERKKARTADYSANKRCEQHEQCMFTARTEEVNARLQRKRQTRVPINGRLMCHSICIPQNYTLIRTHSFFPQIVAQTVLHTHAHVSTGPSSTCP